MLHASIEWLFCSLHFHLQCKARLKFGKFHGKNNFSGVYHSYSKAPWLCFNHHVFTADEFFKNLKLQNFYHQKEKSDFVSATEYLIFCFKVKTTDQVVHLVHVCIWYSTLALNQRRDSDRQKTVTPAVREIETDEIDLRASRRLTDMMMMMYECKTRCGAENKQTNKKRGR